MRRKTVLRSKLLLREIEKTAEMFVSTGNEHASQIIGLTLHEGRYHPTTVIVAPLFDNVNRDRYAEAMGQLVEPFDAYIYLCEGWTVSEPLSAIEARTIRPSQDPNRIEIFMLHFVTKLGEQILKTWKIIRPETGQAYFEHLNDTEKPLEGRFANFYEYTFPESKGPAQ